MASWTDCWEWTKGRRAMRVLSNSDVDVRDLIVSIAFVLCCIDVGVVVF